MAESTALDKPERETVRGFLAAMGGVERTSDQQGPLVGTRSRSSMVAGARQCPWEEDTQGA